MSSTRSEVRALTLLSLPIIGANLGTMMLGTVDALMVGRLSKEALAAATLGNTWTYGTMFFAMGIVYGIDPIVSQAHGAGDGKRAGLALQRGSVVAVLVSVPLALLWLATGPALRLFGQTPELAAAAHEYTVAQIPTIPFFMVFVALRQYLQGRGIVRPTLVVTLVANVFNAFFNWALIYGHLGLPPLGVVGAGIATGLTRAVMLVALLWIVLARRLHRGAWVRWSRRAFALRGLREVLWFGIPVALQMSFEMWAFGAAAMMAGWLGTTEVATHAIVLNMAALSFMVPLGISFGAVTRVGNLIGAGDFARAQLSAWIAFSMGATVMVLSALVFALLRFQLPHVYSLEPEVLALCASILPVAAAFQIFDGVQVVGSGILRGMGRTLPAAWFNLLGYWVLALPLAWWMAFRQGLGLHGVWWGLALGLAIVAALLVAWVATRGPATLGAAPSATKHAAARGSETS